MRSIAGSYEEALEAPFDMQNLLENVVFFRRLQVHGTAIALGLVLAACSSTGPKQREQNPWLEPSPTLRQQIEDQTARLPWTHGAERVEQIRWFAGVGEPAYQALLRLCLDNRPDVAGAALAALGATGDSRLVDALHALKWSKELDRGVELERARTYLRLGDWAPVCVLVDGLSDENLWARSWCAQALHEATGQRFGYDPKAETAEREAAAARWREWIASRAGEGILAANIAGQ